MTATAQRPDIECKALALFLSLYREMIDDIACDLATKDSGRGVILLVVKGTPMTDAIRDIILSDDEKKLNPDFSIIGYSRDEFSKGLEFLEMAVPGLTSAFNRSEGVLLVAIGFGAVNVTDVRPTPEEIAATKKEDPSNG